MIIGSVAFVLGALALIAYAPVFYLSATRWSISTASGALLLIGLTVVAAFGLATGVATFECDPASPWFGFLGSCYGGIPWP